MGTQKDSKEKSVDSSVIEDLALDERKTENIKGGEGGQNKQIAIESFTFIAGSTKS